MDSEVFDYMVGLIADHDRLSENEVRAMKKSKIKERCEEIEREREEGYAMMYPNGGGPLDDD